MNLRQLLLATGALALFPTLHAAPPDKLELKMGDRISVLGNALALFEFEFIWRRGVQSWKKRERTGGEEELAEIHG